MSAFHKLPRVYTDQPFKEGGSIVLPEQTHHYLRNVMRMEQGQCLRLFNGRDGEFIATLESLDKKNALLRLDEKIKDQPQAGRHIHLLFVPIRKERMDWLIEKAVELGATHLHPVLTQNADLRKINGERVRAQIIEAAEQCERLDIPHLEPLSDLTDVLASWSGKPQIYAALERYDAVRLSEKHPSGDCAVLIGPSGGFMPDEMQRIASKEFVIPVSLGDHILRSETAAVAALSLLTI